MSQLIDSGFFDVVFDDTQKDFVKTIKFNVEFEEAPIVLCGLNDSGPGGGHAFLSAMVHRTTSEEFDGMVKPILNAKAPTTGIAFRWIALGTAKKA